MKKVFFFAAIAGVALASCAKVETLEVATPDVPISFSPIAQVTTKANAGEQTATYSLTNASGNYESFTTWARYNTGAKTTKPSDATIVFYDGIVANPNKANAVPDYWSLATAYYWPKDGYLSFHAFSPSDVTVTEDWGKGVTLTNYTIKTNTAEQIDLLYSDYELGKQRKDYNATAGVVKYDDEEDSSDPTAYIYDGVNIKFNHALSSIGFKAKIKDNAYTTQGHKFKVKKIEILYPYQTGTFTENRNADATNGAYASKAPTAVTGTDYIGYKWDANENTPYWAVMTDSELDPATATYVAFDGESAELAAATATDLYGTATGAKPVLAMPQNLVHASHTVSAKVTYTYQFKTGDTYTLTTTVPLYKTGLGATDGKEGSITEADKWLINHKYIYTLVFTLDEIIFDPAVGDFVTVNVDEIELPEIDA